MRDVTWDVIETIKGMPPPLSYFHLSILESVHAWRINRLSVNSYKTEHLLIVTHQQRAKFVLLHFDNIS